MIYLYISLPFLVVAIVMASCSVVKEHKRGGAEAKRRQLWVLGTVTVSVLILTIIFDNLMIWAGLVGYDDDKRVGWQLGQVPVEDLFYAIFVTLLVPALWKGHSK